MSITKRPITKPIPADDFINRAPDAAARQPGRPSAALSGRENKKQIAITIAPTLLASIDAIANRRGMSRAAIISLACSDLAERDAKS
ncbi:hypothetical protein [Paraburkholderia tropica]|uniref:hypothetical protein n=1 Tax=Paraburkholderia tropica TaxID=92647 RepID=UPI002AB695A4|nr:hypothetical protein [Paraburkholderia tropica]